MHIIEDTRQKAGHHEIKHKWMAENGVHTVRCKLPFGDYAPVPPVSIDTKQNMEEIAANICGSEHRRFIAECKLAKEAGCQLIVLVENTHGFTKVEDVSKWVNPRCVYSSKAPQGPRLRKAMETITARYGVIFQFCSPEDSGRIINEVLGTYEPTIRRSD